jgi:hypothetical protein
MSTGPDPLRFGGSDNVTRFLEQADLTDVERNAIAHGNAEALMRI